MSNSQTENYSSVKDAYFKKQLGLDNLEAAQKAHDKGTSPSINGDDILLYVYWLLLDAANTNADSSMILSKQLQGNAEAQRRLNDAAAQLQWYKLPKAKVKTWTKRVRDKTGKYKTSTVEGQGDAGPPVVVTYRYTKVRGEKVYNQVAIDQAEARNREVAAERSTITQKIKVLEQHAQTEEGVVNGRIDASITDMQEGSKILMLLQALTYKALLRNPVQ